MRGEAEDLSSIVTCVRKDDETTREYANSFTGTVAVYVNLKSALNPATSRQFAIVLNKNAKLTNGTINEVMFQLKSKEGGRRGKMTMEVYLEDK